MATSKTRATLNPWEVRLMNYKFQANTPSETPEKTATTSTTAQSVSCNMQDAMFYPGLYSGTGFDMMGVLLRVASRPNPKVVLGPVDCSVAIIICDLLQLDHPIVYASEAFTELTGYSTREVIGKNCRFLQFPPGAQARDVSAVKRADKVAIQRIHQAVYTHDEIQVEITNYKKDGQPFTNILTIIPIQWDSSVYRYAVGFQVEAD